MNAIYRLAAIGFLVTGVALFTVSLAGQVAAANAAVTDAQPTGQPAHSYPCYTMPNVTTGEEYCILSQPTGSTVSIGIIRSTSTGIIRHTNFIGEPEQVTLGDLVAVLGQPTVQQHGNRVHFVWLNNGITATSFSPAEFSDSLPLWRVAFATSCTAATPA